jgi:hypothetical protein
MVVGTLAPGDSGVTRIMHTLSRRDLLRTAAAGAGLALAGGPAIPPPARPRPGSRRPAEPALGEVAGIDRLEPGTWHRAADGALTVCIDLPRGSSTLARAPAL